MNGNRWGALGRAVAGTMLVLGLGACGDGSAPSDDTIPSAEAADIGYVRLVWIGCGEDDRAVGTWDPHLDARDLQVALRHMLLTRIFDDRMLRVQRQGKITFYMKSLGEEAVAVGQTLALEPGEALLAFGPDPPNPPPAAMVCNLSPSGDLIEAARLKEMRVVVDAAPTGGTDYFVVPDSWQGGAPKPVEGADPAAAGANPLDKAKQDALTFGATVITKRMLESFLKL